MTMGLKGAARLRTPAEAQTLVCKYFGEQRVRVATAGYSTNRDPEHPKRIARLLHAIVRKIGPSITVLVTSPTTATGSIDRVTSHVAFQTGCAAFHVTATDFERSVQPGAVKEKDERKFWEKIPKCVLPSRETYSEATAWASHALLVFGGRNASVSDAAFALQRGNRVVAIVDEALDTVAWDENDKRPMDAARYLTALGTSWKSKTPTPLPELPVVNAEQRARWPAEALDRLHLCSLREDDRTATEIALFVQGLQRV